jgi:CheY-like chemotaxis protein
MPGGGRLSVKTANRAISSRSAKRFGTKAGEYAMIAVSDTGVGMNQATLDRIFEPFFTTKDRGHGTGLGLSSAYGIIQNHNGFIEVQSQEGRGSTFSIFLPAVKAKTAADEMSTDKLLKGKETVLLVDDEKLIADIGSQCLTKLGYTALTAASGREAVEIYQKQHQQIDLIILDMIMPGMGGEKTFERLKEINPDVKVLLASGYSIESRTHAIMKSACNAFIQKPFNLIDFSQKLRAVLDCEC